MKLKDLIVFKEKGENVAKKVKKFNEDEVGEEDCLLEYGAVYDDGISYDADFEELLNLLDVKVVNMIYNGKSLGLEKDNYVYLYDGKTQVLVPFVDEENRHDEELPDETFVFFNEVIEITSDKYFYCQNCRKLCLTTSLIVLDKANEKDGELICKSCYCNMVN